MSGWNYKELHGFEYLEKLLNIDAEYREVELAREEVRNSDLHNKNWHAYKYGEKLSKIRYIRDNQLENLHSIAYIVGDTSICCCGLVLGSIGDDDALGKPLLPDITGHILYPAKELTSLFVVCGEVETTDDGYRKPTFNWHCQECDFSTPAIELPEGGYEICTHECEDTTSI